MTRTKSVKALLCVLLSMTLIIAFMPQTANVYAASAKKATSITKITSTGSAYTLSVGQSRKLTVRVNPKNLTSTAKTVYVSSSNKSVAKPYAKTYVKKNGYYYCKLKVKGMSAGTATVTAKTKTGKKATWKITVKAATALTGVTLSKTKAVMVGDELTATAAPSATSVEYQWYADGVAIDGATANTYTVVKDNIGKKLTVKATGLGKYTGTVTSEATEAVVKGTLTGVKVVVPTGNTAGIVYVGQTLKAETTPAGAADSVSYQWYKGTVKLADANAATYTIPAGTAAGTVYHVVVTVNDTTAFNAGSVDTSATVPTSEATVKGNLASVGKITVATTATTATASVASTTTPATTLTKDTHYEYAWYVDSVSDATKLYEGTTGTTVEKDATVTYTDPYHFTDGKAATLVGHKLIAVANGIGDYSGSIEAAATNTITSLIGDVNLESDAGTGVYQLGATVTASFTDTKTTATYQWTRNGAYITGATTSSYVLTVADENATISCVATGTGSYSGTKQSTTFVGLGAGTIKSVAVVGSDGKAFTGASTSLGTTLYALTSPATASAYVDYQWYKDTAVIAGATGSSYTPTTPGTYHVVITKKATADNSVFTTVDTPASSNVSVLAKLDSVTLTIKDSTNAVTSNAYIGNTVSAVVAPTAANATLAWKLNNSQGTPIYAYTYTASSSTEGTWDRATNVTSIKLADVTAADITAAETAAKSSYSSNPTRTIYCSGTSATAPVATKMSGSQIYCEATGTASEYSGSTAYAKTATVTDAIKTVTLADPTMGTVVTPVVTLNSGATPAVNTTNFTFQWYVGGVAVTGTRGTAASYTPSSADYGKSLKVAVTSKLDGITGTVTAQADGSVLGLAAATNIHIDGTAVAGTTLKLVSDTTDVLDVDAMTTYTVKWYKVDAAYVAADANTHIPTTFTGTETGFTKVGDGVSYAVQTADAGHSIFAVVTTGTGAYVMPGTTIYGIEGNLVTAN